MEWRSKAKSLPANGEPGNQTPLYEGQVDLTFVVSDKQPWGYGFFSEQVNKQLERVSTHQSLLHVAMKAVRNPVTNYYMFSWCKPLWMPVRNYIDLGTYLDTDAWAEISNAGHIRSVTYRRGSLTGEVINEPTAIEISACFDFAAAMAADAAEIPPCQEATPLL